MRNGKQPAKPAKSQHGTYSCYKHTGCRCLQCRMANAAYQREFYAANAERLRGYAELRRAGMDPTPCMVRKPRTKTLTHTEQQGGAL